VVRPGCKNFYAYSAVCPASGEDFSLLLPCVDTRAMNAFLGEMAGALGGRRCVLVMDRAGWHMSKDLKVPPNIRIVFLPPYSPELIPSCVQNDRNSVPCQGDSLHWPCGPIPFDFPGP
jgi:transposase